MKNKIPLMAFLLFCVLGIVQLSAREVTQGYIRLVLHEATGRFTLYGMVGEEQWAPLFSSQDPRTSFLAINVNDRIFRMGEASAYRSRVEENTDGINYFFESATLQVQEEFSFIKTEGFQSANGVRITFYLKNLQSQPLVVGMRFLIDTNLGEGSRKTPFYVNQQSITDETIINSDTARNWVSRGEQLALMGSVDALSGESPNYLHIANWKRLNEVSWKATLSKGRNFNYPPYSIGDSAVCYYYDPKSIAPNDVISYSVFLALEDSAGFDRAIVQKIIPTELAVESPLGTILQQLPLDNMSNKAREADLDLLYSNIARLNLYLDGSIEISEEELAAMELTINMLKARYGLP